MDVTVVRYRTSPEQADANQALVEAVFAGLSDAQPEGLRYATFRLEDGATFVHVAAVEPGAADHPLTSQPAFQAFLEGLGDRCEVPPVVASATVVGSYGFGLAGEAVAR